MQDFAAELRAAREPLSYAGPMAIEAGERRGGFESYLVSQAVRQGFDLGYEAGDKVASDRYREQLEDVRERSRLAGFDAGARVLLQQTLLGLQEVVGELESKRASGVMLKRVRAKLDGLVYELGAVARLLPDPSREGLGVMAGLAQDA